MLEASQKQDVVKSSAATACLFHTKHNFVYIFIGKLGPTHLDAQTRALAAGLLFQGAGENRAVFFPSSLQSELQELPCRGGGFRCQLPAARRSSEGLL